MQPIYDFYTGRCVFLTGATGFIGKAFIEKLLRSCDGIEKIYILIREKKDKTVEERWTEFISDKIFQLNHIKISQVGQKIVPIYGDLTLPNLGISDKERQELIDNVTAVFHIASYVKFNPPLREAIEHNVRGTLSVVQLCHQIKQLDVLVYVSTITLLMHSKERKELVYPTPLSPEHVIEACDKCTDSQLKKYVKLFFPKFPNTYTISKALAEQVIARESKNFNIAIIRPSATNPAYREPEPGWVLGIHGPSAVALLGILGILRVAQFDYKVRIPQIPVDFVVNAIISSAWFEAIHRKYKHLEVYHLTTQSDKTPSLLEMIKMLSKASMKSPSKRMIRPPYVRCTKNIIRVRIEGFIRHWIYAYVFDFLAKIMGLRLRIVDMTAIMIENLKAVKFFAKRGKNQEIDNTRYLFDRMSLLDKQEFDFDVSAIDWEPYYDNIWMGMRRYLLNEDDKDIPRARIRLRSVIFKYRILMMVWYLFLSSIVILLLLAILYGKGIDVKLSSFSLISYRMSILDFSSFIVIPIVLFIGYKIVGRLTI